MSDKERDALMRLTMCARNECVICKYKNEYTDSQCYELQTKCMNILAESLKNRSKSMSDEVTKDDINTMRIMFSADIEKLWNQGRGIEAVELQEIRDRLITALEEQEHE